MNTTFIAMSVALIMVLGLVAGLVILNFLFGGLDWFFGKPKLKILKTEKPRRGLAFSFSFNSAKEPARYNRVQVRLFNPFSKPTQVEVTKEFDDQSSSFELDLDMGPGMEALLSAIGTQNATVQIEVASTKDGISFQYPMKAHKFKEVYNSVEKKVSGSKEEASSKGPEIQYGLPPKDAVADTVPGKGDQLFIPVNPAFAAQFAGAGGGAGAADGGSAQENFKVAKVWIEPGCIVCNACEDIFPEVFHVTADTCIINDNPPLDDGLKIQEAAEACPVEVIKFNKA